MDPETIRQKIEDVTVIRDILRERHEPLSLENARLVLAVGRRNRPEAWTITQDELPEFWTLVTQEAPHA